MPRSKENKSGAGGRIVRAGNGKGRLAGLNSVVQVDLTEQLTFMHV